GRAVDRPRLDRRVAEVPVAPLLRETALRQQRGACGRQLLDAFVKCPSRVFRVPEGEKVENAPAVVPSRARARDTQRLGLGAEPPHAVRLAADRERAPTRT